MIRTALYYPYNYISRPLLCTALLLWDRLEFIAPRENLSPETADPLVKEAFEIIAASHLPNEYEKQAVHKQIQDFLAEPSLPKSFFFDRNLARSEYGLYPETLLPDTWRLLRERDLVQLFRLSGSHGTFEALRANAPEIQQEICHLGGSGGGGLRSIPQ